MHNGIFWLCTELLLFAFGQLTEAALGHGYYHDDAHPGKCTISETIILAPGESALSPDSCAVLQCDNDEGLTTISSCGAVGLPPGCEWGDYVNEKAPYPECCERHMNCTQKAIDIFLI